MKPIKKDIVEDITGKSINKLRERLYKAYLKNINSFRDNSVKQKLSLDLYYQIQEFRFPIIRNIYENN
jgi:hypothetical protein